MHNKTTLNNAQELKKNTTTWYYMRNRQINGFQFTRQKSIGNYIVDFVCRKNKLIIELDGDQHGYDENIVHDNKSTEYLEQWGYRVLRFWNNEVYNNITNVLEMFYNCLNDLTLVDIYNFRPNHRATNKNSFAVLTSFKGWSRASSREEM